MVVVRRRRGPPFSVLRSPPLRHARSPLLRSKQQASLRLAHVRSIGHRSSSNEQRALAFFSFISPWQAWQRAQPMTDDRQQFFFDPLNFNFGFFNLLIIIPTSRAPSPRATYKSIGETYWQRRGVTLEELISQSNLLPIGTQPLVSSVSSNREHRRQKNFLHQHYLFPEAEQTLKNG